MLVDTISCEHVGASIILLVVAFTLSERHHLLGKAVGALFLKREVLPFCQETATLNFSAKLVSMHCFLTMAG